MTSKDVGYEELLTISRNYPGMILAGLSEDERKFLLSVKEGNPDFSRLSIEGVDRLPAIRWKIKNIQQMNPKKKIAAFEKLKSILQL